MPDELETNRRRAVSHLGELCPCLCIGHLAEVVGVERMLDEGVWHMLVRYRCDHGHDHVWARERFDVGFSDVGTSESDGIPGSAAVLAACMAAAV